MGLKLFWVSLGCAKNRVSSEEMLYSARRAGHETVPDPGLADVAVINTCGFITEAKLEGIEQILELAAFKPRLKLLVCGCLAQRYREEFFTELPEVDGLIGCGSFGELNRALEELARGGRPCYFGALDAPLEALPRLRTTPRYTAYLRVAEGCDNRCAYCVIPSLRGPYRSRTFESLVREAEELAADGVKELIVIAQDTSRYGLDLYGRRRLGELLDALCAIEGLVWIRLHYLYPDGLDEALMDQIAKQEKIVKYLDIPIQHCSDRILRAMNRRGGKAELAALFQTLRARIPGAVLRTSLIVGFPGETDAEFEELCAFVQTVGFERAGVFAYSQEEGTPAAKLDGQIPEDVKLKRREILTEIAAERMDGYGANALGTIATVLCEGYDRAAGVYFGRSCADSPEVDGKVFFRSRAAVPEGTFVPVRLTELLDGGDLLGRARGVSP
jgi:ribosomal protein S12 methylthiotransferase